MKKTEKNLYLLYMLFAASLITANCISSKVCNTGISFRGSVITFTSGVISYPITFLITDVIGEMWGKQKARLAVKYGFTAQVMSMGLIVVARYVPAVDGAIQHAYVTLLGQQWIMVIASLTGYTISQSWDVMIFHGIRNAYVKKHGTIKGGKWIWNNCSTITSQFLDSLAFSVIAFGLGSGWVFDTAMYPTLLGMILGQWLFKVIIALCDTPIFYLLTRDSTTVIVDEQ